MMSLSTVFKLYLFFVLCAFVSGDLYIFNISTLIMLISLLIICPGKYQQNKIYRIGDPKFNIANNEDIFPFRKDRN